VAGLGIRPPASLSPTASSGRVQSRRTRNCFVARLPALGDRMYILFLSRLHFKKGLDYLADAFRIVAGHMPT